MIVCYVNGVPSCWDFGSQDGLCVDRITGDVYYLKGSVPTKVGSAASPGSSEAHTHEQSEVTGLEAALTGKQDAGSYADEVHSHSYNDLTDKPTLFSGSYDDLTDQPTLGGAASKEVGTSAGTVAAGDHTHAGGGSALDAWPVGSVYIAVDSTSPATRFGGGTWSAFGAGRVLVGRDSNDTDFDTAEETGGAKTVTLTAVQSGLPQHTHTQNAHTHTQNAHTHQFLPRSGTSGSVSSIVTGTLDTSSTISGANQPHVQNATAVNQDATAVNQNAGPTDAAQAHNNVQPYIVVYMWKRTA